jgi:drug/metabolite transporter (DMT)-like permease
MEELKKRKLSLAKIMAIIGGVIGFIFVSLAAISAMINSISRGNFVASLNPSLIFSLGAGLLLGLAGAIAVAIVGFVIGYIISCFYNFCACRLKGKKVESEEPKTPEILN